MAARKKATSKTVADKDAAEELSFESALERLEGLVDRLEDGELELEESLGVFEQGVALSKQCATKLEAAERKVEKLVREGGEWLARPFDDAFEERENE
ncbi:MAG: exodeoxyribonuclease VII small subunit [Myxococcota bacterium]|jgi:exodeoxyribonuclease VII small subunit